MSDPDMLTFEQLRHQLEGKTVQSVQLEETKYGIKIIFTNGSVCRIPFSKDQYIEHDGQYFDDQF